MNAEDYTIIDKYLDDKLTAREQVEFQKRLEADREFASEVTLQQEMRQYLRQKEDRQDLDRQLKTFDDRYFPTTSADAPRIPLYRRRALLVAAGLALIVIVGLLIVLNLSPPSLYDKYAQHPSLSLTEMSGAETDLTQTEAAFNSGNYAAANRGLEGYLQQNPTDTMALLFKGISLLELGRFQEAGDLFSTIGSGQSDFSALATWYLALTYLRQDQPVRAEEILVTIPSGAEKYPEAQELLRELE